MGEIITGNLEHYGISTRNWQGIPSIDITESGTLFASWYSGGNGEGQFNYVMAYKSNDNGRTFSGPLAVVDPPGYTRAYDPAVFTDSNGNINWFWAESNGMYDGRCGVWRSIWKDGSFTQPERLCHGIMMNKPTITKDGRWLLPSAIWNMKPYFGRDDNTLLYTDFEDSGCYVYGSADNGQTFLQYGKATNTHPSPDEHMIVEKLDGSLWMLIRTKYGIGESFSYDNGKTWTETVPSNIESPVSRFFIRRMPSGRLLLINHCDFQNTDNFETNRNNLTAFLSEDDGKTWPYELLLDERNMVSYPDAAIDGDTITVIYDRDRHGDSEILTAHFKEQEIIDGNLSESNSYLKNIISSRGLNLG
jgi:hypothetical protein